MPMKEMIMNVETKIHLNKFSPREYQLPLCKAFDNQEFKRYLLVWPRRAGKDVCAFNLMIRQAIKKVGVYYYIFPTYSQARKVVWDSITNSGEKFLDYIPKQIIKGTNGTEMKINLTNGSLIQLIGSDNIDNLMGTNPIGLIFSEYALQDPRAYQFLRPILLGNGGWAMFISTPRGKNHLWELYNIASNSKEWFCSKLSVEDTNHIDIAEIEKEIEEGLLSPDLAQQEYYTSFTMGVEGSYYAKYLDKMRLTGRIGVVPYESSFKVHTAWDIGVSDSTCIIFYQVVGQTLKIIDFYEKNKEGLEHYAKILESKPYTYGKHFAPPDVAVYEWGAGMSRIEKARQLGIKFEVKRDEGNGKLHSVVPSMPIEDGIESVRSAFSKIWIDEFHCKDLIKCLENYRQEYDPKKRVYKNQPLHNWSSHAADAMRYLCISLSKTSDGTTPEELEARYQRAINRNNSNLPRFFSDPY